jgi:hypothetical protein
MGRAPRYRGVFSFTKPSATVAVNT